MKKIIYLFLTLLIVSCDGDDADADDFNHVDYFFEVEFAGTTYRVEGNTEEIDPFGTYNQCNSYQPFSILLGIGDKSAGDYVSGENFSLMINLDNPSLGSNTGKVDLNGSTMWNYLESIGCNSPSMFTETELSWADGYYQWGKLTNINITDLGTAQSADGYGETMKGTYEGILWYASQATLNFDIPVPIKIEFETVRGY